MIGPAVQGAFCCDSNLVCPLKMRHGITNKNTLGKGMGSHFFQSPGWQAHGQRAGIQGIQVTRRGAKYTAGYTGGIQVYTGELFPF